jgi:hypothetical protein
MRTKYLFIAILLFTGITSEYSCKSMAKAAAKHWTKKQIKEFKKNCNEKATSKFSSEKAVSFCDCATDVLKDKVPDFTKAMALSLGEMIKEAGKCALN